MAVSQAPERRRAPVKVRFGGGAESWISDDLIMFPQAARRPDDWVVKREDDGDPVRMILHWRTVVLEDRAAGSN